MQNIVIIGATSLIAVNCAEIWCTNSPITLHLVGRDYFRTQRIANDLKIKYTESVIHVHILNFNNYFDIEKWTNDFCTIIIPDIVLISHGVLHNQVECQNSLSLNFDSLFVNGISPVFFAEVFARHMEIINKGTIAIIGSVAGDIGRKSNYIYGSAKSLVSNYVHGLQHRLNSTNVKVVLIKPGPTKTPMTADLIENKLKLADVNLVAKDIVRGIAKGSSIVYTPSKWFFIMLLLKVLPKFLFYKLNI